MLEILFYAFPSMMIIIALYLFMYRDSLVKLMTLDDSKLIKVFSLTYFLMSILGFVLVLNQLDTWVIIWIILSLILTSIMLFTFYKLMK
ncbi:hypothetical protein [Fundicoccus culcitae]|uniref:Uncharacterized protein n=1 Tax=Fundicoccus culcitae TaxID=2969821 RepID=A0ABY5P6A9_9LACT|nr:hypothetical protein [Fundicoccus culcitae]UUX34219.1 hypothetical protein NRE15_00685 [Fundicoccus culcitae]